MVINEFDYCHLIIEINGNTLQFQYMNFKISNLHNNWFVILKQHLNFRFWIILEIPTNIINYFTNFEHYMLQDFTNLHLFIFLFLFECRKLGAYLNISLKFKGEVTISINFFITCLKVLKLPQLENINFLFIELNVHFSCAFP